MSSRVDLEELDAAFDVRFMQGPWDVSQGRGRYRVELPGPDHHAAASLINAYPALRDEIKRLRKSVCPICKGGDYCGAQGLKSPGHDKRCPVMAAETAAFRERDELRDEIKRLRLELAAKKQHIRACHAAAHGTIGIADDALREAARLEVEAKRTTEKAK